MTEVQWIRPPKPSPSTLSLLPHTNSQEAINHRIDLVGYLDRAEMAGQQRLRDDELRTEFLEALQVACPVHQGHVRGNIRHRNPAGSRRRHRIMVQHSVP